MSLCNHNTSGGVITGNIRPLFSLSLSLCQVHFPSSLQDRLRLDVRVVSLCQACFPPSLLQGLRLDVRLVCLCYNMSLCNHNTSGGVITGNIRPLFSLSLSICLSIFLSLLCTDCHLALHILIAVFNKHDILLFTLNQSHESTNWQVSSLYHQLLPYRRR
jgi:hypothetical protein